MRLTSLEEAAEHLAGGIVRLIRGFGRADLVGIRAGWEEVRRADACHDGFGLSARDAEAVRWRFERAALPRR